MSVPVVVLLLCGQCHREQNCDLSPFPDRKKQITAPLSERMSEPVLAAFFPSFRLVRKSLISDSVNDSCGARCCPPVGAPGLAPHSHKPILIF